MKVVHCPQRHLLFEFSVILFTYHFFIFSSCSCEEQETHERIIYHEGGAFLPVTQQTKAIFYKCIATLKFSKTYLRQRCMCHMCAHLFVFNVPAPCNILYCTVQLMHCCILCESVGIMRVILLTLEAQRCSGCGSQYKQVQRTIRDETGI